jgi:hypothetical protein
MKGLIPISIHSTLTRENKTKQNTSSQFSILTSYFSKGLYSTPSLLFPTSPPHLTSPHFTSPHLRSQIETGYVSAANPTKPSQAKEKPKTPSFSLASINMVWSFKEAI